VFSYMVQGNPIGFEVANYARHPMISDVDYEGKPVFINPTGFPWGTFPIIAAMHHAFEHCLNVSKNYDITPIFELPNTKLVQGAQRILNAYANWQGDLGWNHTLFAAEHDFIFRELERRKR